MKKIIKSIKNPIFIAIILFCITALISSIFILLAEKPLSISSYFEALWWSIVTMSTTGYGDIVPATTAGRIIGIGAMLFGIVVSSLITGAVALTFFNRVTRSQRGLMNYKKLKNHLVICGWKDNMQQMLKSIISSDINNTDVVVVANVPQTAVDAVFHTDEFSGVKFVRGESYGKEPLIRAGVVNARKVCVLADTGTRERSYGEKSTSVFEADSRTVMTVISVKAINKNVYITAQLLERNFEIYLRKAGCDEILFSNDLASNILSQIVLQEGMSNIINALIGQEIQDAGNKQSTDFQGYSIGVQSIKPIFVGKTYQKLIEAYSQENASMLALGILENTDTFQNITKSAMRDAQKTANFTEMVSNLRQVKRLQSYNPVLVPPSDYVIPRYSSLIVLERKSS